MKKKINLILISVVTVLSVVFYFLIRKDIDNQESYQTIAPVLSSIEKTRYVSGVVVPSKEIEIKSQFSGILEKLYCKIGDSVNEGDKIAKIKLVPNPSQVESAEKNVKTSLLEYKNHKRNYELNKDLFENKVIPATELKHFEQLYLLSKEEYSSAVNQLDLLKEGKKGTNIILATTKGTVLELPLKEGSSVIERNNFNEGTTIANIADLGALLFKGAVNEADVGNLKVDTKLHLIIPSLQKKRVSAKLISISPKGIQRNNIVYFDIIAQIINDQSTLLKTGFSAVAEIVLDRKERTILIEEKNMLISNDSVFVELLKKENGTFRKHYIETGISDGLNIEVKKGLSVNDMIKVQDI